MDIDIVVFLSLVLYVFFIILRYWKEMLIYNIVAIVPLILLLVHFSDISYELVVLFGAMIILHISDFFISLNK